MKSTIRDTSRTGKKVRLSGIMTKFDRDHALQYGVSGALSSSGCHPSQTTVKPASARVDRLFSASEA